MSKKLSYGLKTKAVTGNPPKWLSMATAIVALLIVAKEQIIGKVPGVADTALEHISQWYDWLMNIAQVALALAVIFTGYNDDDKPDTDDVNGGYRNTLKTIILLVAMGVLCSSCSKKTLDVNREYSYTDSSWKTYVEQLLKVKGGATPATNMDSLKKMLQAYLAQQNAYNPEHPGVNTLPPNITNQIYTIPDTSGNYELQYWMSSTGELMARCVGKDQTINMLVEQNNRLIERLETTKEVKTVTRLPTWFKWFIGIVIVLIILWFLKGYITKWLPKKS